MSGANEFGLDRHTIIGWSEGSSPSSVLVPNRNGCGLIALGSLDTTGAVVIVPQSSNWSGMLPFVVSADAPFVGHLDGPYNVIPYLYNAASGRFSTTTTLDLLSFERIPRWFNKTRTPLIVSATQATGVAQSLVVNVRGRKRVSFSIVQGAGSGTANNFAINCYQNVPVTPGGAIAASAAVDTLALTASTGVTRQFLPDVGLSGSYPGVDIIDTLSIASSSSTWSGSYFFIVEAWD